VFDDELVCASIGVRARACCGRSSRFRRRSSSRTTRATLAGWTVERYQIDFVAAAETARQVMEATLRDCARRSARRHASQFGREANYHDHTFKHILAPIWLLTYTYGRHHYQVLVERRHGRIRARGRGAGSRSPCWCSWR
jgi:hypothetical protein